jgi:hypothetical protein
MLAALGVFEAGLGRRTPFAIAFWSGLCCWRSSCRRSAIDLAGREAKRLAAVAAPSLSELDRRLRGLASRYCSGTQVANPPRRRYLREDGLLLHAYGDEWDARGHLVRSPEFRTAP